MFISRGLLLELSRVNFNPNALKCKYSINDFKGVKDVIYKKTIENALRYTDCADDCDREESSWKASGYVDVVLAGMLEESDKSPDGYVNVKTFDYKSTMLNY